MAICTHAGDRVCCCRWDLPSLGTLQVADGVAEGYYLTGQDDERDVNSLYLRAEEDEKLSAVFEFQYRTDLDAYLVVGMAFNYGTGTNDGYGSTWCASTNAAVLVVSLPVPMLPSVWAEPCASLPRRLDALRWCCLCNECLATVCGVHTAHAHPGKFRSFRDVCASTRIAPTSRFRNPCRARVCLLVAALERPWSRRHGHAHC